MRILVVILGAYALIVLAAWLLQYRLLYFPQRLTLADVQRQADSAGLSLWPRNNDCYRGLMRQPRDACRGTVLVFHGNAGAAVHRVYYADALVPLGYRVILAEYPGYGARKGKLGEASFVTDARQTIEAACGQFGSPLFLWGESLGCGVAAAGVSENVNGIVLLTPWDSLTNLARSLYRFLPVRLLLRDRYDTVANLKDFHGPAAVVMAARDEVIPNNLTEKLYQSLSEPKQMWRFENAGHNSWPSVPGLRWWKEVMNFIHTPP